VSLSNHPPTSNIVKWLGCLSCFVIIDQSINYHQKQQEQRQQQRIFAEGMAISAVI
jgi:hypothetical protein